eukprot:893116-Pleurochrysis_carterae.AAC.1
MVFRVEGCCAGSCCPEAPAVGDQRDQMRMGHRRRPWSEAWGRMISFQLSRPLLELDRCDRGSFGCESW